MNCKCYYSTMFLQMRYKLEYQLSVAKEIRTEVLVNEICIVNLLSKRYNFTKLTYLIGNEILLYRVLLNANCSFQALSTLLTSSKPE